MKITTVAILALCACATPQMAAAQTMQWTDKGYVTVNGGYQSGSHDLSQSGSFPLYDETATVSSTTEVKGGGMFDVGGAYKIWKNNLLVGLSYSHVTSKSDGSVTGSIPDPVFFDRPRAVSATVPGLKHTENQVHIDAIWMMPVANKLDVGFSFGPTIFAVKQDTIPTLTVTEPGPTVTAPVVSASKTTVGVNLGVDVQYMVAKKWGVGGLMRYSFGSVTLPGASEKLTVGGFQIGGGVRLRFLVGLPRRVQVEEHRISRRPGERNLPFRLQVFHDLGVRRLHDRPDRRDEIARVEVLPQQLDHLRRDRRLVEAPSAPVRPVEQDRRVVAVSWYSTVTISDDGSTTRWSARPASIGIMSSRSGRKKFWTTPL